MPEEPLAQGLGYSVLNCAMERRATTDALSLTRGVIWKFIVSSFPGTETVLAESNPKLNLSFIYIPMDVQSDGFPS